MSIFRNDQNMPTYWLRNPDNKKAMDELKHNFDAFGYMVPNFRRENTNKVLKGFGLTSKDRFTLIQKACEFILQNEPHSTMNEISKKVDVTGTYMIMGYLLTGTPKKQKEK
jgi:hypothetical protein